jgi:hypothetical protein
MSYKEGSIAGVKNDRHSENKRITKRDWSGAQLSGETPPMEVITESLT